MTKLEEKFSEAIEKRTCAIETEHGAITQNIEGAAVACYDICKEEMKKFDAWKGQDGWIPTLNNRGALFYKCSKGQASFEQLIEIYLNQEGENKK